MSAAPILFPDRPPPVPAVESADQLPAAVAELPAVHGALIARQESARSPVAATGYADAADWIARPYAVWAYTDQLHQLFTQWAAHPGGDDWPDTAAELLSLQPHWEATRNARDLAKSPPRPGTPTPPTGSPPPRYDLVQADPLPAPWPVPPPPAPGLLKHPRTVAADPVLLWLWADRMAAATRPAAGPRAGRRALRSWVQLRDQASAPAVELWSTWSSAVNQLIDKAGNRPDPTPAATVRPRSTLMTPPRGRPSWH